MRRNIKNDKVLRAISIGLATMIAVTSTPVTVFASGEEGVDNNDNNAPVEGSTSEPEAASEPSNGNGGGNDPVVASSAPAPTSQIMVIDTRAIQQVSENTPKTVESVSSYSAARANAAEGYTGTLEEGQNAATGVIGTGVQSALDDISNANSAMAAATAFDTAADKIDEKIDKLYSQDHKSGGVGQLDKAEDEVVNLETTLGVKVDENGNIVANDKTKNNFAQGVTDTNTLIDGAESDKTTANNALNDVQQAADTLNAKDGLIEKANGLKGTADTDTTAANTEKAKKDSYDSTYQGKLDAIAGELKKAVVDDNIKTAVTAAVNESSNAAQVAGDNYLIAQDALKKAEDAATEAQNHVSDYTRQQMINIATAAQSAADDAKSAADLAENALKLAQEKEKAAQKAVKDAQDALGKANEDAVKVLQEYQAKINAINKLIETANGSRSAAQTAMIEANKAIDAAIALMQDPSGKTVTGAKTAALAYQTAMESIKNANDAITDLQLMKDKNGNIVKKQVTKADGTKEWVPLTIEDGFTEGNKTRKNAQMYLDGNGKNITGYINELKAAKKTYDDAVDATKTVQGYRDDAAETLKKINDLVNGTNNYFDMWAKDAEQDIKDLRALLATGTYSYQQLLDTVKSKGEEFNDADSKLVEKNNGRAGNDDKNLTSEQIVEKYNEYDARVKAINGGEFADANQEAITAQGNWITEFNKMKEKYKLNSDGSDFVKENGEYVLSDAYKALQAACDPNDPNNIKPDDYKYVNENDETDVQSEYLIYLSQAQENNGNKIYVWDYSKPVGQPEILSGTYHENAVPDGGSTFEKGEVNGKTVIFETQQFRYNTFEPKNDKKTINKTEQIYSYPDNGTDTWKQEVVRNRLKDTFDCYAKNGVYTFSSDGKTVTVMTVEGISRTFKYEASYTSISDKTLVYGNPACTCTYSVTITETTNVKKEKTYTQKQAYDCKVYNKENYGGGLTDDAKKALEDKNKIDNNGADPAKYDSAKKTKEEKAGIREALQNELSKKDAFVNALKDEVEKYNTASDNKKDADAAKKKYDDFDQDSNDTTKAALSDKDRIAAAKTKANEYLKKANDELEKLDEARKNEVNVQKRYEETENKIKAAKNRLTTVQNKLDKLRPYYDEQLGKLKKTSVDKKVQGKSLEDLYQEVVGEINELNKKKFDTDKYNALGYVYPGKLNYNPEKLSIDVLSETLSNAIKTAGEILEREEGNLKKAVETRKNAEIKLKGGFTDYSELDDEGNPLFITIADFAEDNIMYYAEKAQEEADRAAKALADWRAPESDDDDGDDSGSGSSSSSTPGTGSYVLPGAGTGTLAGIDLTGMTFDEVDRGVAGARTGRTVARGGAANTSGVLGVKTDLKVEQPVINKDNDGSKTSKTGTGDRNFTKVENNLVPLADTPFEEGMNMNYLWLLAVAAAAGAGTVGYANHKKKVAASDEAKKYKKYVG